MDLMKLIILQQVAESIIFEFVQEASSNPFFFKIRINLQLLYKKQ